MLALEQCYVRLRCLGDEYYGRIQL